MCIGVSYSTVLMNNMLNGSIIYECILIHEGVFLYCAIKLLILECTTTKIIIQLLGFGIQRCNCINYSLT